jgi:hypothetical protein
VAFEQCRRVVKPCAVKHVQLQQSTSLETVSAYAAIYLGREQEPCRAKKASGRSSFIHYWIASFVYFVEVSACSVFLFIY